MFIVSHIAGVILVILWIKYLHVAKTYTRIQGSVPSLNVWQFNILPILTAICLFLSGDIIYLPLMGVFWFLPNFLALLFRDYFMIGHVPFILTILYGWKIGIMVGELFDISFSYWSLIFGISGILIIQVICSLIFNYITGLDDKAEHMGGD